MNKSSNEYLDKVNTYDWLTKDKFKKSTLKKDFLDLQRPSTNVDLYQSVRSKKFGKLDLRINNNSAENLITPKEPEPKDYFYDN
jgi:hypothetical protein